MRDHRGKTASRQPVVRTVLGDVPASTLGHTQTHEHIVLDGAEYVSSLGGGERFSADEVTLTLATAIPALLAFKAAGGGCLVDSTSYGLGRDPQALAQASKSTGVHIVMGGSAFIGATHPKWLHPMSRDELADLFVDEFADGVGNSGIRVGILGEVGLSDPVSADEDRVFRASIDAQLRTGLALQVHCDSAATAMSALTIVETEGGSLERLIVSHMDLYAQDLQSAIAIADSGAWVAYDLFGTVVPGQHSSAAFDDHGRVDLLVELGAAGRLGQVLVSQDIGYPAQLAQNGGHGYHHFLTTVSQLARARGLTDTDLYEVCVKNPARCLAVT